MFFGFAMATITSNVQRIPPNKGEITVIERSLEWTSVRPLEIELNVSKVGRINAVAKWSGSASHLSILLYGPGKRAPYKNVYGKSPFQLSYGLTEADLRGYKWHK